MADLPGEIHPASGGDVFPDECIRLGCDHPDVRGTAAAAPTAIFAVASSQLYGLNVNLAESSFLTTTLAFLFVLYPVIYWWEKTN